MNRWSRCVLVGMCSLLSLAPAQAQYDECYYQDGSGNYYYYEVQYTQEQAMEVLQALYILSVMAEQSQYYQPAQPYYPQETYQQVDYTPTQTYYPNSDDFPDHTGVKGGQEMPQQTQTGYGGPRF